MSELWYYRQAGQLHGPMTFAALSEIAAAGKMSGRDEVRSGHGGWQPAPDVFDVSDQPPARQESSMLDSFQDILGEAPAAEANQVATENAAPAETVYFCRIQGKQEGPFSVAGLQELISEGRLQKYDRVLADGTSFWLPCSELTELDFSQVPAAIPRSQAARASMNTAIERADLPSEVADAADGESAFEQEEPYDEDDPFDEDDNGEIEYDDHDQDDGEDLDVAASVTEHAAPADIGAASWSPPNSEAGREFASTATASPLSAPVPAISAPLPVPNQPKPPRIKQPREKRALTENFSLPPAKYLVTGVLVIAGVVAVGMLWPNSRGPVHGQVTIDGAPVPLGIVSITPRAGTKGPSLSVPVIDGRFDVTSDLQLSDGAYSVSVTVGSPLKMEIPQFAGTEFEKLNGERFQADIDTRTMESASIDLQFSAGDAIDPKKNKKSRRKS